MESLTKSAGLPSPRQEGRAVRILAKSIYRELSAQGYDDKQIVALATELIGAVTTRISSSALAREAS